jgi:hypothetical protein
MPSRRLVMSSIAVLLAGCSAPFQSDDKRTVLDSDIEIAADEYRTVEFELEEKREVEFGISDIENAEIDILFLSRTEFEAFAQRDEFESRYSSGVGVSGGFAEDTVPAGGYVVVFDNTDRSEATPDGPVSGHARGKISPPD